MNVPASCLASLPVLEHPAVGAARELERRCRAGTVGAEARAVVSLAVAPPPTVELVFHRLESRYDIEIEVRGPHHVAGESPVWMVTRGGHRPRHHSSELVADLVTELASLPYWLPDWVRATEATARSLGAQLVEPLLGILAAPPAAPADCELVDWVARTQLSACLLLAHAGELPWSAGEGDEPLELIALVATAACAFTHSAPVRRSAAAG